MDDVIMPKLVLGPACWLVPLLGWTILAQGAIEHTVGSETRSMVSHEIVPDTVTVVDLHPVRDRTFRALVNTEIFRARQRGQHPFLELGGSGCGVCNALHARLDMRPLPLRVRTTFAGTTIIRIAVEEWPNALAALGLPADQRIPLYVAVDTAGRVVRLARVDYWTLRSLDTDTLNSLHQFFLRPSG